MSSHSEFTIDALRLSLCHHVGKFLFRTTRISLVLGSFLSTLQSEILTITIRAVSGLLRKKAKTLGIKQKLEFAVVTVIQIFGGSINLNPHLHILWVDGLYDVAEETLVFHRLSPADEEIRDLVETLSTIIVKCLEKRGYPVDEESEISENANEANQY